MKNKIAKIIKECIDDYYRVAMKNEYQIAQEIIDLINLEKAKENCYQEEKMRLNGWLHKDDTVKGLRVERACERKPDRWKIGYVTQETNPLTVGEALEIFVQVIGSNYLLTDLVTKDGGKIVKEEK